MAAARTTTSIGETEGVPRRARGWVRAAVGALCGLGLVAMPATGVTIDGRISPGEYTQIYSVDYAWGPDGVPVSGGIVAFAQDAAGLHLYYQAPLTYVDNTWGCESGTGPSCTQIDKYKTGPHTLRRMWFGDTFGVKSSPVTVMGSTQGDVPFVVDLVASGLTGNHAKGSGAQFFATGGVGQDWSNISLVQDNGWLADPTQAPLFLAIQTSTAWNIQNFGPGGTGAISQNDLDYALATVYKTRTGVFRDSPATDASYTDPTSDDPRTAYNDALFSGWNFAVAFELTLDPSLFPNGEWIDPANHVLVPCGDGRTCMPILDFGGAHFSNNKVSGLGGSTLLDPVSIVPISIPEPGSLVLLGLAGLGVAGVRRLRGAAPSRVAQGC